MNLEVASPTLTPCARCGTFVTTDGSELATAQKVCEACRARSAKQSPLWTPWVLVLCGTFFPPSAWLLAMVNWWRLGRPARLVQPVAALFARLLAVMIVMQLTRQSSSGLQSALLTVALNAGSMQIAIAGMPDLVTAQRQAGRASASWLVAVGLSLLPLFCFVGMYQVFSRTGR